MIEILTDNHYDKMLDLFEGANEDIRIISPFISFSIAEKLCEIVKRNANIKCIFITRFYLEDMLNKANSIDAIEMMMRAGIEVYALKGLHTKLYLFDKTNAVLGSANFTAGGFVSNVELSLCFENEREIIDNLYRYFHEMLEKIEKCPDSMITEDVLTMAREKYIKAFNSRKQNGNHSTNMYMFGASVDKKTRFGEDKERFKEIQGCAGEYDIVNEMFKQAETKEQKKYNHTIWLKFHGHSDSRIAATNGFPMTDVILNGKKIYLSNYPFKVNSIKENDEIYLAALTTDANGRNQPVIMGRGYLRAFTEDNYILDEWIQKYDWMSRYPWYAIIGECSVLDTAVANGIPMDVVWDELRSDTYMSSFGKNETIGEVAKKHYQKAHIRLSGNAKDFIDKKFDELAKQYGTINYKSK